MCFQIQIQTKRIEIPIWQQQQRRRGPIVSSRRCIFQIAEQIVVGDLSIAIDQQ
jgi:hypothetical protein